MAERKAVNKYYPPEWEPKHGSINKFRGQHHLRERARKLDQGILIVRFEMPFNVWCEGCNNHIGQGVRYNAEKKQAGKYFSTKIWSFRMKCHLCDNWMEIHTDPQNRTYTPVSGVRRKNEEYDAEDNETVAIPTDDEKAKLSANPFYKLERDSEDQEKARQTQPRLHQLIELQDSRKDTFSLSQQLRASFRTKKKEIQVLKTEAEAKGLAIELLPASEEDAREAHQAFVDNTILGIAQPKAAVEYRKRKHEILSSSLFDSTSTSTSTSSSTTSTSTSTSTSSSTPKAIATKTTPTPTSTSTTGATPSKARLMLLNRAIQKKPSSSSISKTQLSGIKLVPTKHT